MPQNQSNFSNKLHKGDIISYYELNSKIDRILDSILINKHDQLVSNFDHYSVSTNSNGIKPQFIAVLDSKHHFSSFLEYIIDPENQKKVIEYMESALVKKTINSYATASITILKDLDIATDIDLQDKDTRKAIAIALKASSAPLFKVLSLEYTESLLRVKKWNTNNLGKFMLSSQVIAMFGLNRSLFNNSNFTVDYSQESCVSSICAAVTPMLTDLYFCNKNLRSSLIRLTEVMEKIEKDMFHPLVELFVRIVLSIHAAYTNFGACIDLNHFNPEYEFKDFLNLNFMKYLDFVLNICDHNVTKFDIDNPSFLIAK